MIDVAVRWQCPSCDAALVQADETLTCPACRHAVDRDSEAWQFLPSFEPRGFSPERAAHLASIESDHFWFPPRKQLLTQILARIDLARKKTRALELGCGGGGFLAPLAARFDTVVGVDAYSSALGRSGRCRPSVVLATADVTRVPLMSQQFDVVVALDVLEHVDRDRFLSETRRLARPNGWLLLSVPAFPCLWSALDEAAGHRCRYRRSGLEAELSRVGWRLEHWTHYQALLFPLVFASRRFPGHRFHGLERRPPKRTGRLLGAINRLEVRLFARRRLRFGSSLVALARRAA